MEKTIANEHVLTLLVFQCENIQLGNKEGGKREHLRLCFHHGIKQMQFKHGSITQNPKFNSPCSYNKPFPPENLSDCAAPCGV